MRSSCIQYRLCSPFDLISAYWVGVEGHEIICAVTCQSLARFCHSKLFNFPHRLMLNTEHSLVCYLTYISDTKSLSSLLCLIRLAVTWVLWERLQQHFLGSLACVERQISQDEASSWWKTQKQQTIKTFGDTQGIVRVASHLSCTCKQSVAFWKCPKSNLQLPSNVFNSLLETCHFIILATRYEWD